MMISTLLSRLARVVAPTVLAGVVLTSCVQEQEVLIVENAVWFSGDDCTLSASSAALAGMTADVSFDSGIGIGFVLTNNQIPNENSNTFVDDSEIYIESAMVSLSFSGGAVSGGSFEAAVPTNSMLGGESQAVLIIIPAEVGQSIRATMANLPPEDYQTLEIEVVFSARKTNGVASGKRTLIETRPFVFPLQICYGCLNTCVDASQCGGTQGSLVCPDSSNWSGLCGFAQGSSVVAAGCSP